MTNRMFTLLMWALVAVSVSYGFYLNLETVRKDVFGYIGTLIAINFLMGTFFAAVWLVIYFVKTFWGMI